MWEVATILLECVTGLGKYIRMQSQMPNQLVFLIIRRVRERLEPVYPEDHDDSRDWTGPAQKLADQTPGKRSRVHFVMFSKTVRVDP